MKPKTFKVELTEEDIDALIYIADKPHHEAAQRQITKLALRITNEITRQHKK